MRSTSRGSSVTLGLMLGVCGHLNEKWPSEAREFEHLVPVGGLCVHIMEFRRCNLVGGSLSLGLDFEGFEPCPTCCSLCFSQLCPHLSLPVIILSSFPHHMNSILWNKKLSKPFPSLSCLWSWLFFFFGHRKVTKTGSVLTLETCKEETGMETALIPVCSPAPTPPCFLKPCSSLW